MSRVKPEEPSRRLLTMLPWAAFNGGLHLRDQGRLPLDGAMWFA